MLRPSKIAPGNKLKMGQSIQQALAHHRLGQLADAARLYQAVLDVEPEHVEALRLLGMLRSQQGDGAQAIALISRALLRNPRSAKAHSNLGNVHASMNRHVEAIESFDQALALKPDDTIALNNRGNALYRLRRYSEALAGYDHSLRVTPRQPGAWNNRGNTLVALNRLEAAIESYSKAIAMEPAFADAYCNRGAAFMRLRRNDEALFDFDKAISIKPHYPDALAHRGGMLQKMNRHADAMASYDKVLAIDADYPFVLGATLQARKHIGAWADYRVLQKKIIDGLRRHKLVAEPFGFLTVSGNPADQLLCASLFALNKHPPVSPAQWQGRRYQHARIRLAYLSADFHDHATAYLMAELLELHDRSAFEIIAVSFGPDRADALRRRVVAAVDRFVDVRAFTDEAAAQWLADNEVDIAVDIKGYTTDSRPGILAHRAAPVQVNFLGFPGTFGAPYIDYLIADAVVIPPHQQAHYAEKVVYLPDCYQPNDSKRKSAARTPARATAGLPEDAFVFCCFNNNFKISPDVFDVWMRLLLRVDGSVLWLLRANAAVERNLRGEAAARGVDPARLIFAPRASNAEHLARHRLADLFLDTLLYNAHTTASDALWMGLPVVTCAGQSFASRVAASLLSAIGMPELITHTLDDYEALALKLATTPALLRDIRLKLAENRLTTPLFDTRRFRRHIESAYRTMHTIHQAGESPRVFSVAREA